mgnify:CR=1 FL=1
MGRGRGVKFGRLEDVRGGGVGSHEMGSKMGSDLVPSGAVDLGIKVWQGKSGVRLLVA